MSLGVFLTRAQPFTNAHKEMIKEILKENENVCIVIGSSDKFRTKRNPFTIQERLKFIKEALNDLPSDNIYILPLPDWINENNKDSLFEWGSYLYYNIVGHTGIKDFKFYYSDVLKNEKGEKIGNGDLILNKWFLPEIKKHITYVTNDRSTLFNGISATKVRKAIIEKDLTYLKISLPMSEFKFLPEMQNILLYLQ